LDSDSFRFILRSAIIHVNVVRDQQILSVQHVSQDHQMEEDNAHHALVTRPSLIQVMVVPYNVIEMNTWVTQTMFALKIQVTSIIIT
jgi:hypothetical protein